MKKSKVKKKSLDKNLKAKKEIVDSKEIDNSKDKKKISQISENTLNKKEENIEIKEDKNKEDKNKEDNEPSWYHYLIVLLVIFFIFIGIYFAFEFFYPKDIINNKPPITLNNSDFSQDFGIYPYKHKIGNITYNIEFSYPIEKIQNFNAPIQINRLDILNTVGFNFVFLEYNGTDNGKITISASKFFSFFKRIYFKDFGDNQVYSNYTCANSTQNYKAVILNPYSNRTGVFFDKKTGCIQMETENIDDFILLNDKLLYEIINE